MKSRRSARIAGIAAIVIVLIAVAAVAGPRVHLGRFSGLMIYNGGDGGGGTTSGPAVTSIILDVSGSTGDIHVRSATIGTTVGLTVLQSDPNFKTLYDLYALVKQGNMAAATRTMYLHYAYSDGTTALYTLNNAYESQLTTNMTTGIATAVMNPQSVTHS
jgi:hypothetical protein